MGETREEELTYTGGKGGTVIDYVLVNEEVRGRLERMEVGDKVDSDHHTVVVQTRKGRERGDEVGKRGGRRARIRLVWGKRKKSCCVGVLKKWRWWD